jgi:hypothetical protein
VGIQAAPAVQAVSGSTEAAGSIVEHLNWGYIQLGLVALAFGGLQVWWIGSTLKKQRAPRPMGEGEFRKALERIWNKERQKD